MGDMEKYKKHAQLEIPPMTGYGKWKLEIKEHREEKETQATGEILSTNTDRRSDRNTMGHRDRDRWGNIEESEQREEQADGEIWKK